MKKIFSIFLSALMVLTVLFVPTASAYSEEPENSIPEIIVSKDTEYLSNGYSIITIITEKAIPQSRATTFTKSASKYYVLLNEDLEELWRFTVHGTFSVNSGVSSSCTAVSYSYSISEDVWENESASCYRSGNQAIGDATFIKKLLLITVERKSCHVVLTCDKNGNLS